MNNVIFNSHDFSSEFIVGNIQQQVSNPRPVFVEKGGNGTAFNGMEFGELTFVVTLYLLNCSENGMTDEEARRAKLRTLASWLCVDSPKKLEIGDDQGLYYMAVPSGEAPFSRYVNASSVEVTFIAANPIAYGDTVTVTVPSGGSLMFTVDGTYFTKPTITANAARDGSSQVWGLKLDNGAFLHVATGSSSARDVVLDCENRTLTIQGAVALPTLDSDWFELAPGTHTLAMDKGTGAATVTYKERWL